MQNLQKMEKNIAEALIYYKQKQESDGEYTETG